MWEISNQKFMNFWIRITYFDLDSSNKKPKNDQSYQKHFGSKQNSGNSVEYARVVEPDDAGGELKEWGVNESDEGNWSYFQVQIKELKKENTQLRSLITKPVYVEH